MEKNGMAWKILFDLWRSIFLYPGYDVLAKHSYYPKNFEADDIEEKERNASEKLKNLLGELYYLRAVSHLGLRNPEGAIEECPRLDNRKAYSNDFRILLSKTRRKIRYFTPISLVDALERMDKIVSNIEYGVLIGVISLSEFNHLVWETYAIYNRVINSTDENSCFRRTCKEFYSSISASEDEYIRLDRLVEKLNDIDNTYANRHKIENYTKKIKSYTKNLIYQIVEAKKFLLVAKECTK